MGSVGSQSKLVEAIIDFQNRTVLLNPLSGILKNFLKKKKNSVEASTNLTRKNTCNSNSREGDSDADKTTRQISMAKKLLRSMADPGNPNKQRIVQSDNSKTGIVDL